MKLCRSGSILQVAAALLLAAAAFTAAAQQKPAPAVSPAGGQKIGFVNTQRVLRDSVASMQVQKNLEAEVQKRTKEIEAGPKADIARRKAILADDMNLRRQDVLKQFIERANRAIRRVGEAENFDVVVIEANFASTRIDITDRVIKALDSER